MLVGLVIKIPEFIKNNYKNYLNSKIRGSKLFLLVT